CEGNNDRCLNIVTPRTDHLQKGTVRKIKYKLLHASKSTNSRPLAHAGSWRFTQCGRLSQTSEAPFERIGAAAINGSWFVRGLQRLADHAAIMHDRRHIDWIGQCGGLLIVSAPSPVMAAAGDSVAYFYVHTLTVGADGNSRLLDLPGRPLANASPVAGNMVTLPASWHAD
ncbi:MAG: hypothetical protein ACREDM_12275, partial [Methylocella sp.]